MLTQFTLYPYNYKLCCVSSGFCYNNLEKGNVLFQQETHADKFNSSSVLKALPCQFWVFPMHLCLGVRWQLVWFQISVQFSKPFYVGLGLSNVNVVQEFTCAGLYTNQGFLSQHLSLLRLFLHAAVSLNFIPWFHQPEDGRISIRVLCICTVPLCKPVHPGGKLKEKIKQTGYSSLVICFF